MKIIKQTILPGFSGLFLAMGMTGCEPFSFFGTKDSSAYDRIIQDKAAKYGIDSRLVKAVIWKESRFDSDAVGRQGEIGLMQVMPDQAVVDWARVNRVKIPSRARLFQPELNVEIGTWYLSRGIRKYRKYDHVFELALCRYNAGQSRSDRWAPEDKRGNVVKRITIPSTREYVTQIMKRYKGYCLKKDKN